MRELLLDFYMSSAKRKPDQIIIFRDGVSESQFNQVLNIELDQIIELQYVEVLPKKVVDILKEIRDLLGVLSRLTKEFNVDKFLGVFLESLMDYSHGDDLCLKLLLSMIKVVPINVMVVEIHWYRYR
uniref:Piwi domain-containing protein n=1 Tax=Lactuca sativa TaxID=4236 RepID=A0A9R1WR82_LACSA|nr:hypothetical protein LSAT_V11C100026800 [Lactuca sativa]